MDKVLTYDIPDYKIKLKIRQRQVISKKIQDKLITQAMNGTSVDNRCSHQVLRIEYIKYEYKCQKKEKVELENSM